MFVYISFYTLFFILPQDTISQQALLHIHETPAEVEVRYLLFKTLKPGAHIYRPAGRNASFGGAVNREGYLLSLESILQ